MTKKCIRPDGMRMKIGMRREDNEVTAVKMIFSEDGREFAVKMDLNLLRAIRDAAEDVLGDKE